MIKTLRLHSFKAFQDTGEINLKPVTVLAGPNSGGKTSILQSLLLLKQTLETEAPDIDLNLDGRFLQFSAFNELTFGKPPLRECEVSYDFKIETSIPTRFVSHYYPDLQIPEGVEQLPLQSNVEFSFRYREVEDEKEQVIPDSFEITSSVQDTLGPRLAIAFQDKGNGVELSGIDLPEQLQGKEIESAAGRHFLPQFLVFETYDEDDTEYPPLWRLDPIFWLPLRDLETELKTNLRYLGPLRAEPQRAYMHSGSRSPEIGTKGEHAAQILWLEKDDEVTCHPSLWEEPVTLTLLDAVSNEFQRLGITQPIEVESTKAIIYQILFGLVGSEDRKQVTIADVGFGVSQLLPVVVMGLRAPETSILLFEQPEIHLHPRVQAKLADFFLRLASPEKRIIVETHSDHFINRLRRRIAEDPTDELKEKVNILFVRPPCDGQGARVDPLRVDRYGVIENWPPDFLPESADEAEAIFQAGLKKRQGQ
ncbi:MAG: AAA family ATPase [Anaerolineae bacterium]